MSTRMVAALGIAAFLFLGAGESAEAAKKKPAKATPTSLYQRLGGTKAITAVVNDFVGRCAKDKRINSFFAATASDPKRLNGFKNHLTNQICEAAGGPCKYTGKDMKTAHQGMGIRNEDFNALVENLQASLNKFKVKQKDQNQLLAVLSPMKGDIVEPGPSRGTASDGESLEPAPPAEEERN